MPPQHIGQLYVDLKNPLDGDAGYHLCGCVCLYCLQEFKALTMHVTQTCTEVLVVPEEAVQKNRATGNHHHGSQDQANRADNHVDAHRTGKMTSIISPCSIIAVSSFCEPPKVARSPKQ